MILRTESDSPVHWSYRMSWKHENKSLSLCTQLSNSTPLAHENKLCSGQGT